MHMHLRAAHACVPGLRMRPLDLRLNSLHWKVTVTLHTCRIEFYRERISILYAAISKTGLGDRRKTCIIEAQCVKNAVL